MIGFIDDHRGAHGVEPICKVLPIAPSTYRAQVARRRDPATLPARVRSDAALMPELTQCLRTGRALRVPRARTRGRSKSFVTPEILISARPAEAEDRTVPGHWEGDLILGLGSSAIGTLVERTTRFTMLLHLPPMEGLGRGCARRTGRRWPGMVPRRCATRLPARSPPCPSSCVGR
jgi:hypothetical protein